VDPSDRSVVGDVIVTKTASGKERVLVQVRDLGEPNFAIVLGVNSPIFTTNFLVDVIAPLDRFNLARGGWRREFVGNGAAPVEFQAVGITDVSQLAGRFIAIAKPGVDNLVQTTIITNVVNGETNIISGSFIPIPEPSTTNNSVLAIAWAPFPALSAHPGANSFKGKQNLVRPGPPNPSPNARGWIKTHFNASSGESVFEIRITHMIKGQTYTVWITDDPVTPTEVVKAGDLTLNKGGSAGHFFRDTRFGDPLPQQFGDVTKLSGRTVEIRDAFDVVHLVGEIP